MRKARIPKRWRSGQFYSWQFLYSIWDFGAATYFHGLFVGVICGCIGLQSNRVYSICLGKFGKLMADSIDIVSSLISSPDSASCIYDRSTATLKLSFRPRFRLKLFLAFRRAPSGLAGPHSAIHQTVCDQSIMTDCTKSHEPYHNCSLPETGILRDLAKNHEHEHLVLYNITATPSWPFVRWKLDQSQWI